jgi:hypothetical protein
VREVEKLTRMAAIRKYFGEGSHPVTLPELKALTAEERQELAIGAAKELGVELEEPAAAPAVAT